MKTSLINLVLFFATISLSTGCNGAGDGESESASNTTTSSEATAACTAVEALDVSLDDLEDSESMDEYRVRYDVVRQDFETLRNASGGKYADETKDFEAALDEFEASMSTLGEGGLISGLLELAGDAAELAEAGDNLDDAIDCP